MDQSGSTFILSNNSLSNATSAANKVVAAIQVNSTDNSTILAKNVMDNYLKKHKLDLQLLPNKKMIKLSDLTMSSSSSSSASNLNTLEKITANYTMPNSTASETISTEKKAIMDNQSRSQCEEKANPTEENEEDEIDEDYDELYDEYEDEEDEEEDDDDDEYDEDDENEDNSTEDDSKNFSIEDQAKSPNKIGFDVMSDKTLSSFHDENLKNESDDKKTDNIKKRDRKKREPSLKLKQKLSNEDLETIVACVKNRQAEVYTADVKKENYVDKILRVKLLNDNDSKLTSVLKLSNGKMEALLKKSMFSKDLNSLFDTFVSALCIQDYLIDEAGVTKPTLKCLVVDCEFKSFSEAEIMRHIKRHLAQDGYTCSICSHQFASMTNLQRHLRIHSGDIGKEIKCAHCDYKASTITHVKRHMAHKHLERSLPCPHCSFMGATNAELKIHMARKHLELTGKNPLFLPKYLRKDYQCSICKEQYNDFKEYQTHMYEHTSSLNRFQCNVCPYNCKNFSKLKRHMLYHTGARNFECKICGNKFFQMEHLKRHMQSIHNILSNDLSTNSSLTSNKTQTSKCKKILKTPKDFSPNNMQNCSNVNGCENVILVNENDNTVLSSAPTSSINNQNLNLDSNFNNESVQECLKITSKCMYKCQKCEFSTNKLFTLNDHVINKHMDSLHYLNQDVPTTELNEEELDENFLENIDDDDDDDDEQNEDKDSQTLDSNDTNSSSQNSFSCAFCVFKTVKKLSLKSHLQNNHSSQVTAPILLSNDSVMVHPNTRFQCGSCKSFLNNVSLFIEHMNNKHKIQVYLIDSNNEVPSLINQISQNQEQIEIQTLNQINGSNTSNKFPMNQPVPSNSQKTVTHTKNIKNHFSQNQHQQIRNFINSSSYLSRQLNNSSNSNTTVRINPLLLNKPNLSSSANRKEAPNQHPTDTILKKSHQQAQSTHNTETIFGKSPVINNQEFEIIHQNQHQLNQIQQLEQNSIFNNFLLTNHNSNNSDNCISSSTEYSSQINNVNDLISNQYV